jgi:hypothetical protein
MAETPTPTRYVLTDEQLDFDNTTNPAVPLLISIIPVVTLILGVMVFYQLRQDR